MGKGMLYPASVCVGRLVLMQHLYGFAERGGDDDGPVHDIHAPRGLVLVALGPKLPSLTLRTLSPRLRAAVAVTNISAMINALQIRLFISGMLMLVPFPWT